MKPTNREKLPLPKPHNNSQARIKMNHSQSNPVSMKLFAKLHSKKENQENLDAKEHASFNSSASILRERDLNQMQPLLSPKSTSEEASSKEEQQHFTKLQ